MAGVPASDDELTIVYGTETIGGANKPARAETAFAGKEAESLEVGDKKLGSGDETKKTESLTIFVIGKTGVGKSTLINSLLGEKKAKVSDGVYSSDQETIEKYSGQFCGIKTLFYDTKGLADPNEDDEKLIKKFHDTIVMCRNQYLVFICLPISNRADNSVYCFARLLASKFGDKYDIWLNSIFVLTQANRFSHDEDDSDEEEEVRLEKTAVKMIDTMETWSEEFQDCLERFGLPREIIMNMPVCAAGRKSPKLPITDNWKETLLHVCLQRQKMLQSVTEMKKTSEDIAAYLGMAIGTAVGCIIPVVGIPVGMTVGGLIGWKIGKNAYEKTVKETEQKKRHYGSEKKNNKTKK